MVFIVLMIGCQNVEAQNRIKDGIVGGLRLKIIRIGPYLFYRAVSDNHNDIDSDSTNKNAYSGYRAGYGYFRGRRAAIPKETSHSDNVIQAETRTVRRL